MLDRAGFDAKDTVGGTCCFDQWLATTDPVRAAGFGADDLHSGRRCWCLVSEQRLLVGGRILDRGGLGRQWGGRWPGELSDRRLAKARFGTQGYSSA